MRAWLWRVEMQWSIFSRLAWCMTVSLTAMTLPPARLKKKIKTSSTSACCAGPGSAGLAIYLSSYTLEKDCAGEVAVLKADSRDGGNLVNSTATLIHLLRSTAGNLNTPHVTGAECGGRPVSTRKEFDLLSRLRHLLLYIRRVFMSGRLRASSASYCQFDQHHRQSTSILVDRDLWPRPQSNDFSHTTFIKISILSFSCRKVARVIQLVSLSIEMDRNQVMLTFMMKGLYLCSRERLPSTYILIFMRLNMTW